MRLVFLFGPRPEREKKHLIISSVSGPVHRSGFESLNMNFLGKIFWTGIWILIPNLDPDWLTQLNPDPKHWSLKTSKEILTQNNAEPKPCCCLLWIIIDFFFSQNWTILYQNGTVNSRMGSDSVPGKLNLRLHFSERKKRNRTYSQNPGLFSTYRSYKLKAYTNITSSFASFSLASSFVSSSTWPSFSLLKAASL